ncbi:hypothetical protein CY34DRAFT_226977 [Suillus luteus UH-Slu-Lm8-n1]|uniref:Uncharacterized protein n=1 Tax=Suillus luteus UH-Slu-Lm8-n1 TaxID=930992 RepID=A0A0D0BCG1_9AGAM|nr:hypothetical protein CY34DRAFT_226977 [Suillus luteus UH-Slu-Lm8-n1]
MLVQEAFDSSVFQNSSNVWTPRASKDPSLLCEGKPFITTLAITFRRCFVLFLEIDSPGEFNNPSAGITVDKDEGGISELPTTPRLHGNNVMEQGLAFYCMDKYSPQIPTAGDIPIDGWEPEAGHHVGSRASRVIFDAK